VTTQVAARWLLSVETSTPFHAAKCGPHSRLSMRPISSSARGSPQPHGASIRAAPLLLLTQLLVKRTARATLDSGSCGSLRRVGFTTNEALPWTRRGYGNTGGASAVIDGFYTKGWDAALWRLEGSTCNVRIAWLASCRCRCACGAGRMLQRPPPNRGQLPTLSCRWGLATAGGGQDPHVGLEGDRRPTPLLAPPTSRSRQSTARRRIGWRVACSHHTRHRRGCSSDG